VKISAAGKPPVLFQVTDSIDYSIASRLRSECPLASWRQGRVGATPLLMRSHREIPVSNVKSVPVVVHRHAWDLVAEAVDVNRGGANEVRADMAGS
jgi:hypothetical protein